MSSAKGGADSGEQKKSEGESLWDTHRDAFETKDVSKYYDPCQDAADRSLRCMYRNAGDRELCQDYFKYVSQTDTLRALPSIESLEGKGGKAAATAWAEMGTGIRADSMDRAYRDCKKAWKTARHEERRKKAPSLWSG